MAIALGSLGECLMTEGHYADGEPLLTESYNILKKVNVPESPALEEARQRLVALFQAWGKPQQAARYSSQVRSAAR